MNQPTWAAAYPLARAGGLFILAMGLGVFFGALLPRRRRLLLAAGAVVAVGILSATAARLSSPSGTPSPTQVGFLVGAMAVEVALIRLAVWRYGREGERSLLLAILLAVGLHFLPMAVAFGPLCAALGATLCLNAGIGLWVRPSIQLDRFWAIDGLIKVGFGALMFAAPI